MHREMKVLSVFTGKDGIGPIVFPTADVR